MKTRLFLLAALAVLALPAAAQSQAFTNRATDLKDQASAESKTVASLADSTEVKVVQRSGGWTKVESGGRVGWVRAFHLRFPTTTSTESSSGGGLLSGITGAFGGGRQRSQQAGIQTVGVRGLSPEELKNAAPDHAALAKAQSYRADKPAAERFAREGRLSPVNVDEGAR